MCARIWENILKLDTVLENQQNRTPMCYVEDRYPYVLLKQKLGILCRGADAHGGGGVRAPTTVKYRTQTFPYPICELCSNTSLYLVSEETRARGEIITPSAQQPLPDTRRDLSCGRGAWEPINHAAAGRRHDSGRRGCCAIGMRTLHLLKFRYRVCINQCKSGIDLSLCSAPGNATGTRTLVDPAPCESNQGRFSFERAS